MNAYLKDNLALAVGISLPLFLILVFFIAGNVSRTVIADPVYDAVFATNYYPNNVNPYSIGVDQGNIVIRLPQEAVNQPAYNPPTLYVFDHQTLTARKIDIDFSQVENGLITDPDLKAINEKKIDPSPASPDGYKFEYDYHSSGFFGDLFGFGHHDRHHYALKKDSRTIPVSGPEYFYQAHFIGWMINE